MNLPEDSVPRPCLRIGETSNHISHLASSIFESGLSMGLQRLLLGRKEKKEQRISAPEFLAYIGHRELIFSETILIKMFNIFL